MSKHFLTYDQQVETLKKKNLLIHNTEYAIEILKQTGYFSLINGYKDIFKNPTTQKYINGTRFEDIVELYYFDEELRQLFLKYLIKIENEIKSLISYYFTEKNGISQSAYLTPDNYNYIGHKNIRDINKLLQILINFTSKPTEYSYINHAQLKYNNVPLWVLTNALTFGNISKMYMLLPQNIQIKVSKNYEFINEKQLSQLLTILVKFRNVCAHGERLFSYKTKDSISNFPLHTKLKIPKKGSQFILGKTDLFSVVISFRYLLNNSLFKKFIRELKSLINKYGKKTNNDHLNTLYNCMGFPSNWKSITRYKKF